MTELKSNTKNKSKSKDKEITFVITCPIYTVPIRVVIGSREYYDKIMRTKHEVRCDLPENKVVSGLCTKWDTINGSTLITIYMPKWTDDIWYSGILYHEILHAVWYIFEFIEEEVQPHSHPFIYLTEDLYVRITGILYEKLS